MASPPPPNKAIFTMGVSDSSAASLGGVSGGSSAAASAMPSLYSSSVRSHSAASAAATAASRTQLLIAGVIAAVTVSIAVGFALACLSGPPPLLNSAPLSPWQKFSIVDGYINAFIVAAWVIYKESEPPARFFWVAAIMTTGSIATSAYVAIKLLTHARNRPAFLVLLNDRHQRQALSSSSSATVL